MNALEIKNLTKVYKLYKKPSDRLKEIFFKKRYHKLFFANKNITFNLKKGETLGIIGVNGAGKSTLLKQIAGVINPTSGEIKRYGKVTALLELGAGFNDEFSGRENIYFNGMLLGLTKEEIDEKLNEIIKFSELRDFIDEPIKTYSSGMKMRLAFSIAIHSNPDIFIVDEALSVGDAHFSAKCTKKLKELKKKNLSIIYVSHDLNSLKILCDRVILLDKGELVYEGDPESTINKYNYLIATLNKKNEDLVYKENDFGNFEAKIESVKMLPSNIVSSGENIEIEVLISSKKDLNITVGILIRDRFGQDIFGTNTHYLNKVVELKKDKLTKVIFKMQMNIGVGKYSLTVALHSDDNHLNNCYHWIDKALEFEIAGIKGVKFVGICKLDVKCLVDSD